MIAASRWRLAAPRGGDDDDVRDVERPHALSVVVLDRVLDGTHAGEVALDVADAVILPELLRRRAPECRFEFAQMSADRLGAQMANMTPDQISALLNRLG